MLPSIDALKSLSNRYPFHRAHIYFRRRLQLFPSFEGGDCYMLASALDIIHGGGKIVSCRYDGGDYHAVYEYPDGTYVDLTTRRMVFPPDHKNYYRFFKPSGEGASQYHAPRTSVADRSFLAGMWTSNTDYIRINGNRVRFNTDDPTDASLNEIKSILVHSFRIPSDMVDYLMRTLPDIFEPNDSVS